MYIFIFLSRIHTYHPATPTSPIAFTIYLKCLVKQQKISVPLFQSLFYSKRLSDNLSICSLTIKF